MVSWGQKRKMFLGGSLSVRLNAGETLRKMRQEQCRLHLATWRLFTLTRAVSVSNRDESQSLLREEEIGNAESGDSLC